MAGIEDDLLADLNALDGGDEDDDEGMDGDEYDMDEEGREGNGNGDAEDGDGQQQQQMDEHGDGRRRLDVTQIDRELEARLRSGDVKQVAKLLTGKQLPEILTKITNAGTPVANWTIVGKVEDDPEYKLVVQASNMAVEIDNEIVLVDKFLRDRYAAKFPELETLVLNPLEYAKTVNVIGNEMDVTKVDLASILPTATIMAVNMSASTIKSRSLEEKELALVKEAAAAVIQLDEAKRTLINYVESRMSFLAPNISAIVGTLIAAKLMAQAGGLTALANIPSCNISLLGQSKKTLSGFAASAAAQRTGFIFQSELVMNVPTDFRMKVQRLVAAKVTLAARVDSFHEHATGKYGKDLRDDIEQAIEKLLEPPPSKKVKALPAPDDKPSKKRAGKRVRREKERYAQTELRKQQNRMVFGVAENEASFFDSSKGLGVIGQGSGKVRATALDSRTKLSLSKKMKQRVAAIGGTTTSTGSSTSGFSTSLAFTPVQGIELHNPQITAARVAEANAKWFGQGFKKST